MAQSHYAHHHSAFPVDRQVPSLPSVSKQKGWLHHSSVSSINLSCLDPMGGILCQYLGLSHPEGSITSPEGCVHYGPASLFCISLSPWRIYQQNSLG